MQLRTLSYLTLEFTEAIFSFSKHEDTINSAGYLPPLKLFCSCFILEQIRGRLFIYKKRTFITSPWLTNSYILNPFLRAGTSKVSYIISNLKLPNNSRPNCSKYLFQKCIIHEEHTDTMWRLTCVRCRSVHNSAVQNHICVVPILFCRRWAIITSWWGWLHSGIPEKWIFKVENVGWTHSSTI